MIKRILFIVAIALLVSYSEQATSKKTKATTSAATTTASTATTASNATSSNATIAVAAAASVDSKNHSKQNASAGGNRTHHHHHHHVNSNSSININSNQSTNAAAAVSNATGNENYLKIYFCPSDKSKKSAVCNITNLNINNHKGYPVSLLRNTSASISFDLTCSTKIGKMNLKIMGGISNREVPFPVPDRDHCMNALKSKCPEKGKTYHYRYEMDVLPQYPLVSVVVKYELVDQNSRSLACFSFPAKICDK